MVEYQAPAGSLQPSVPTPSLSDRVLLERDAELAALNSFWRDARSGRGRLVFLGGEGGAGKTSVAVEFAGRIGSARFLTGACDAGATPRALGPLLDVADELGVGPELDDPDLRRASLFSRVRAALGRAPTLLLLEDVHWADESTMDLIRYLGRRMAGLSVLVLVTFRDDEVAATHPLAAIMGDLATAGGVRRMQLPLLTPTAVAELARMSDQQVDAAALYRNTDGNPFFVTEVLAAGAFRAGANTLPVTIRDAVTARAGRLSAAARQVLDAVAVVGAAGEIPLVLDVSAQRPGALDECVEGGVLLANGTVVAFRHELARQAVLDTLPATSRIHLHRQVLRRLVSAGSSDHRRLVEHAVGCADRPAIVDHAPRAAELAARLGAHREAAAHLRTALRHADGLPAADRADLLERLSYQAQLTSQHAEAFELRRSAVALHEAAGDLRQWGAGQRWLSRLSWFLGRTTDAERYAVSAVHILEPFGPGADLAMAYSNMAHLKMIGGTTADALEWGLKAVAAARAAGNREVEAHALNNVGTTLLRRGELAQGLATLDESLDIALADGLQEHAARAWVNIGALHAAKRRLADAEAAFRTGIAYCAERDLDSAVLYMQSWLSGVLLEQGDPASAAALAQSVLRQPQLSPVSRITASLTTALGAIRRGDPSAAELVAELHRMAVRTAEPLRILPVALLQAEAAWTAGRPADIVPATDAVWAACAHGWEPWIVGELAWWRMLGGANDDVPFELPEPFALMRDGRVRAAAAAWTAIGRPFWAALALAAGDPADASKAVAELLRLDAPASAQAVRRQLALLGRPVPRGPRRTARANPAGITARELEVLQLLVEGLSDAEIAARLTLSERTVGHHVSAILRKLDVPTRSRAAAAAARILHPAPPT